MVVKPYFQQFVQLSACKQILFYGYVLDYGQKGDYNVGDMVTYVTTWIMPAVSDRRHLPAYLYFAGEYTWRCGKVWVWDT